MKVYYLLIMLAFCSCQSQTPQKLKSVLSEADVSVFSAEIPAHEVPYVELSIDKKQGIWSLDNEPFSGHAIQLYPNGEVEANISFYRGKKQGISKTYYLDGNLRGITPYHKNLVHGEVKNWFGTEGHPLLAVRNYYMGKPHGEYKKWYKSGQIFKSMNYEMGKELGMQKAFNENGSLYANYEVRNGRSYGLKRSMLCFELEDEKIKYNETY